MDNILDSIWTSTPAAEPAATAPPAPSPTPNPLDEIWGSPSPSTPSTKTQNPLDAIWSKPQPAATPVTATSTPATKTPTQPDPHGLTALIEGKIAPQPEPSFWHKAGKVLDDITSIPAPEYVASFFPKAENYAKVSDAVQPDNLIRDMDRVAANYMASSKHPIISHIGKVLGGVNDFEQNAIRSSESPVGLVASVAGPAETAAKSAIAEAPEAVSFISKVAPTLAAAAPKAQAVADTIFGGEGLKSIVVPKGKDETSLQYAQRLALGTFQVMAPILGHVVPSEAAKNAAEEKTTVPVSGEIKTAEPKPVPTRVAEVEAAPKVVPSKPATENPLDSVWAKPAENTEPTIEVVKPAATTPTTKSIVNVSPQSFIDKVSSPESHVDSKVVDNYREQIRNGQPIEPLKLELDAEGNVIGADGRHRAAALSQEGVSQVPVEVTRPAPVTLPIAKVVSDDYVPQISKDKILAAAMQRITDNSPAIAEMIDPAKLETPEDIGEALGQIEDHVERNLDPRVGVRISLDAQKELASDLNMPLEDLLAKNSGVAFNAEQSLSARDLLRSSALGLQNLAKQAAAGDTAARSEWAFAAARHLEIENQVMGIRSEAGRGLGSWRVGTLDLPESQIGSALAHVNPSLLDQITGIIGKLDPADPLYAQKANQALRLAQATEHLEPATLDKVTQLIGKLDPTEPGFVGKVGKLIAELKPSTTQDKAFEIYRNMLLSSPATVLKKSASEAMMMSLEVAKKAALGGIESLKEAVAPSDYARSENRASEAFWFSKGAIQTLWNAKKILSSEFDLANMPGFEHGSSRAIKGVTGQIVRTPSEIINRLTNLVYAMNYYGELNSLAARQSVNEGLDGEALAARQEFLAQNPSAEMTEAANQTGLTNTFQKELGATGKAGGLLIQKSPILKALFPFYRTPINLVKEAANFSPLGYFKGTLTGDVEAQVKGLIGSSIAAGLANMAMDGVISGGGPINYKEKQTKEATGWMPYSLRIGNRWVSYNRAEPLGLVLGLAADAVLSNLNEEGAEAASRSQTFVNYLSQNVQNLPFLMQISGLVESLTHLGSGNTAERIADNLLASAIVPSGVKNIAQTEDPIYRTPQYAGINNPLQGLKQTVESRMPGLTGRVPADIDVSGQPIKRTPSSFGGANPFPISTQKNNPVLSELARLGIAVENPPAKPINYRGRPIPDGQPTPAEALQLQKLETQEFYGIASRMIANPGWSKIPDSSKQKILKEIRTKINAGRYGRLLLIRKGAA